MTELTLTAIYEEAEERGFIGYVAELPGANTQGEILEDVRENLSEAVELILNSNREQCERNFSTSRKVIRERLVFRVVEISQQNSEPLQKDRSHINNTVV